jgi:ribosomal protein S18 acetylase RimI-like enzyme
VPAAHTVDTELEIRPLADGDVEAVLTLWGLNVLDELEILSYDRWGPGIAVPVATDVDELKVQTLDPKDGMRRLLAHLMTDENAFCLVAGALGEPCGFLVARVVDQGVNDFRYGQIDELYVGEQFRRQGIASALVAAAMRRLRAADATIFKVEVGTSWSTGRRFWDSRSWEQDAVVYRLYD